jgi:GNAT superfamily N-acetyltransferase
MKMSNAIAAKSPLRARRRNRTGFGHESKTTMLTVRDATRADRDRLARLGETTYRSHFTAIWSAPRLEAYIQAEYGPAAVEQSLQDAGSLWLVAELDGAPIGFAKLNWDRSPPVAPTQSGTELQKIYLRADQTGKGQGRALLEAAIERARRRGSRLLWLDVLKSNAAARAFYERHGFSALGAIPFATDLREIGMWVMARDL